MFLLLLPPPIIFLTTLTEIGSAILPKTAPAIAPIAENPPFVFSSTSKVPNSLFNVLFSHSAISSSSDTIEYGLYLSVSPLRANMYKYSPIEYPIFLTLLLLRVIFSLILSLFKSIFE